MKKIFYTFVLILFANIGYSQFLPTGTTTTDNKYRSGSVGIGYTSAPAFTYTSGITYKLLVNGHSRFNTGELRLSPYSEYGSIENIPSGYAPSIIIDGWPVNATIQMAIAPGDYHFTNVSTTGDAVLRGNSSGSLIIANEQTGNIKFVTKEASGVTSKVGMLIDKNGKVGIGENIQTVPTTAGGLSVANYRLFVKGGILTEEVRVMLANQWADYVFEENYDLPKLEELEEFIRENKHLPNVPSAIEVSESGIELGEMAKIQQEKIEELTLYIIEQNKINKQQQDEIDELKAQVKLLLKKQ